LLVVANATDLAVDRVNFHAPIAHISEIADLFAPVAEGGILSNSPVLEVFHCFRRRDEVSAAGGVFVVVQCDDQATWQILKDKGHLVSRDGRRAVVFLPRHLLGLEAATSVFEAAIHGRSTGAQEPRPKLDLFSRANQLLRAGSILTMGGHHHTIDTASAELHPASPLAPESPVPFYLAGNCKLVRDVQAGALIRLADIEVNPDSTLLALRKKQDALFFG
jgi:predicted homoserine dehydrogenase-like protein